MSDFSLEPTPSNLSMRFKKYSDGKSKLSYEEQCKKYANGRQCPHCKKIKPLSEYVWLQNQNKFKPGCNPCRNLRVAAFRNKLSTSEQEKEWAQQKREKEWEEERKARAKKQINLKDGAFSLDLWSGQNARIKADRFRERYDNDPQFRLTVIHRRRLRKILDNALHQSRRALYWLQCSPTELHDYIESLFCDDMCWEDFTTKDRQRKLSIDHIVPCSWFDQADDDEAALCWHYQNLRPLRWLENIRRSDKGADAIAYLEALPPTIIRLQLIAHAENYIPR